MLGKMGNQLIAVLYIMLMVATVVVVDVLFLRNHFGERLTMNIALVLAFSIFYFRLLKRP